MKNKIYPCLWFDGQAKEAAEFYCSAFGNSAVTSENPLVVVFNLNGQRFMGLNGGPMFKPNASVSFFVVCKTPDELDHLWDKLSVNGQVMMPLGKYPWSEKYGWIQDRFGINWQLLYRSDDDADQQISPCLMLTKPNAGRAGEALNFYTNIFSDSSILSISRYEAGENDVEGNIKHSLFTLSDQLFRAMESSMDHGFSFNEAISFVVDCESQEEIDYFWEKLTEGGSEGQCGWLKDKFGVSWQIVPAILAELMSDPEKSPRVIEAFMKMKKFDIEKLREA